MPLKLTAKKEQEIYNNAVRRLRGMLPPQSLAERLYPNLPSMNSKPVERPPVDGWGKAKEGRGK